uniref:Uncharacterized protein n=1 Tax=Melopsittacus undulatus TaxID=13146 RepID=A0A8C6N805_MELUD
MWCVSRGRWVGDRVVRLSGARPRWGRRERSPFPWDDAPQGVQGAGREQSPGWGRGGRTKEIDLLILIALVFFILKFA